MTAQAIVDRAAQFDLRLAADGEYIDGPAKLPDEVEETIVSNRGEVLYRLALKEHAEVLLKLEKLRKRIDDGSIPYQEREMLATKELDTHLDRLGTLEKVIRGYERAGLAQWYTEGWLMVQSELLGRQIAVVARDREALKNVPASARRYAIYLFEEVRCLEGCTDNQIRSVHAAKRVLGAEVEPPREISTRQGSGKRNHGAPRGRQTA